MKFQFYYLLLIASILFYFGLTSGLNKSVENRCNVGIQSACNYINETNRLIKEI